MPAHVYEYLEAHQVPGAIINQIARGSRMRGSAYANGRRGLLSSMNQSVNADAAAAVDIAAIIAFKRAINQTIECGSSCAPTRVGVMPLAWITRLSDVD